MKTGILPSSELSTTIARSLGLPEPTTALIADLTQTASVLNYRLGDQIDAIISEIIPEVIPNKPISSGADETIASTSVYCVRDTLNRDSAIHILYQGRVRLLGYNSWFQREVTAQLLEGDEHFGTERLLGQAICPYRAVAAGPTTLIRIPAHALATYLSQADSVRQWLLEIVRQRAQLLFLKTQTALYSCPSHQLKLLLPFLIQQHLPAGIALNRWMAEHPGCYWLRRGQICSSHAPNFSQELTPHSAHQPTPEPTEESTEQNGNLGTDGDGNNILSQSLTVGDVWKNTSPRVTEGITTTDVDLEWLPAGAWDTAVTLIPTLATLDAAPDSVPGSVSNSAIHSPLDSAPLPIATASDQPRVSPNPRPAARGRTATLHWLNPVELPHSDQDPAQTRARTQPVLFPKPIQRQFLDRFARYPWIGQQSSSDCGVACLAMVARYWGKHFPLHVLREWAHVGRDGASLKSLSRTAEELGFHARPVRASLNRLAEQCNPWIAHWQGDHFVVIYQVTSKQVILADPALGRRSCPYSEFQTHWTGYALLLDPTDRLRNTEIKQTSLGRYFSALLPYRGLIGQIILVSLFIQVFGLVSPLFTQIILDKVVVQKSLPTLNVFALGLLLFGAWSIGMGAVRQYLLSYFSNRLDLTLVSGFIRHTLLLPLKFFESRRVGDILTRVQENQKIQRFLIGQVVLAWLDLLTGFVYLGLMLYYNQRLTGLVLLLIPPMVLLTLGATPLLRKISREIFKEATDQSSALVEMISGIATIKAAAAEQELRWRWEEYLTRQTNTTFRGQKLGISLQVISGLIRTIGSTALLWYGATLVIQDQLTIGQFVAFNMMIGFVISPVMTLINLWDELQEVLISVERLNDVFEAQPELTSTGLDLPLIQGAVQFENVTFRYNEDEDRNVLQNLSFTVQPGETIAMVGRSGSGKSTLIKLLEALYHPTQGRIWIDGHDLRHVSPQSLRSQMGVVPQECFLFSGTILENITLYRPEFTLEQAIEVAKLAEAHSFIQSLPLGYSTKVGERGSTLSGGQRQRIAIARALLGSPRILILDEATSSLDTESERRFQQNLAQISRDRTTFIIAHRLSTVRNADRILVLDRGVLVEQGNHTELMQRQGLYYHLAQQQLAL